MLQQTLPERRKFKMNNSDELQHFGVKGMKWGVRRYQNKDGTLTKAGVRKYNKEVARINKEKQIIRNKERTLAKLNKLDTLKKDVDSRKQALELNSEKHTNLTNPSKPKTEPNKTTSVKDLSNEELQRRIDRINLENRYKSLTTETRQVSTGKKVVGKVMTEVITPAATDIGKQLVKSVMAKGVNSLLDLKGEDKVYANNKKKN